MIHVLKTMEILGEKATKQWSFLVKQKQIGLFSLGRVDKIRLLDSIFDFISKECWDLHFDVPFVIVVDVILVTYTK